MALIFSDRVKDTTVTSGTGTITLSGTAPTGYQTFGTGVGNANTCYYCIASQTLATWEVGLGTYTSSGTTLSRTAGNVLSGSSGAGTLVSFGSETKDVFVTSPALWATAPAFTGNVTTLGQLGVGTTTLTNGYAVIGGTQSTAPAMLSVTGQNTNSGTTIYGVSNTATLTGTTAATTYYGVYNTFAMTPPSGTTISNAYGTSSTINLQGTSTPVAVYAYAGSWQLASNALGGTISRASVYYAPQLAISASATTNVSSAQQFYADNIIKGTLQTITNAYAFYGNQGTGSATNSWNLYMAGAAPNYMAGALGIGTTTLGSNILVTTGNVSNNAPASGNTVTIGQFAGSAQLALNGSTSGTVSVQTAAAAGTWAMTLPTTAGSNTQALQTDGAGTTSWVNLKTKSTLFSSSGTYTPTTGAVVTRFVAVGAGGGGGGGALVASGTTASGGGGGGGAATFEKIFLTADIGASATITVGAGGTAGAAATVNSTAGGNGGGGAQTTIVFGGQTYTAYGGGGGAGGQSAANSGGGGGGGTFSVGGNSTGSTGGAAAGPGTAGGAGANGANASNANGVAGGGSGGGGGSAAAGFAGALGIAACGGGSGGAVTGASSASIGGQGGQTYGGNGGVVNGGAVGTAGSAATAAYTYLPGSGGGGGGGNFTGTAGAGGAGVNGGGGGGGGSNINGSTAGAGSIGAKGYVWVVEYF